MRKSESPDNAEPTGVDNASANGARPAARRANSEPATSASGLVRFTVNLTPRANQALESVSKRTGDSKTDTTNKALSIYEIVQEAIERDGGSLYIKHLDGEVERIRFV